MNSCKIDINKRLLGILEADSIMAIAQKISYAAFLIKGNYGFDDVIEEDKYEQRKEIKKKYGLEGYIYFGHNSENEPNWYKHMKQDIIDPPQIGNKSTRAVLLVKIHDRIFAFTYGHGRHMINKDAYIRDFGLKVVLNNCEVSKLKTLDTLTLDNITSQTRTQISKASVINEFNLDNNRDLLKGVQAEAKDVDRYGKNISGRESFHFTREFSFWSLEDICKWLLADYNSVKYKNEFDWIDYVSQITDPELINQLNEKLISELNERKTTHIHLSPPSMLDTETSMEFSYTEKGKRLSDINLYDYLRVKNIGKIDGIKKLRNDRIFIIDIAIDNHIDTWRVYDTLNVELSYEEKQYILALGNWYEIDMDYLNKINNIISHVETCPLEFQKYNHENENDYNESVAALNSNIISMDGNNVNVPGVTGKFEFCDLLSNDKHLIHVKRWDRSSTLSHLFSQGTVSANTLINMPDIIPDINEKILNSGGNEQFKLQENRNNRWDYTVVYAIIYKEEKSIVQRLPFFSKINFVDSINKLRSMQLNVQKMRIKQVG